LALNSHRSICDDPTFLRLTTCLSWSPSNRYQAQRVNLAILRTCWHLYPNVLFIFGAFPNPWTSALQTSTVVTTAREPECPACKRWRAISWLNRRVRRPVIAFQRSACLSYFGCTANNKPQCVERICIQGATGKGITYMSLLACCCWLAAAGAVLLTWRCCGSCGSYVSWLPTYRLHRQCCSKVPHASQRQAMQWSKEQAYSMRCR
jgi:hypothetical protein